MQFNVNWLAPGQAALLCIAAVSAPGVAAAEPPSGTSAEIEFIEVITRPELDGISAVDVINSDQLQSGRRKNLADALDLLPGVTQTRTGARSEALVNIRGFDSRQVPLFVDGIPIYVPYDGNIDLARLGVGDVESIRVTKGGGSVLYGPNALGGSINVVTSRPRKGLSLSTRGGLVFDEGSSQQATDLGARVGAAGEHWYLQGSVSLYDQDFFRIPDGNFGAGEDGGRRNNSATRDLTTGVKLGWIGDSGAEWQLAYSRLDGEKQTPPYAGTSPAVRPRFWRWPYYDKEDLYLLGAVPVSDSLWLRTRVFYDTFSNSLLSYDDATYTTQTRPFAFTSNYDDYSYGGSVEAEFGSGAGTPTTRAVVHFKQDVHREVDNTGQPQERMEDNTWSVALEHERPLFGRVTGKAGIGWNALDAQRADNNVAGVISPFPLHDDSAINVQLGAGWAATEDWTVGLNLARKTRFPTLKDRYSYRLGSAIPNPDLKAEQGDFVDLTARGHSLGATSEIGVFGSWLDDAIEAVSLPATACTTPPCIQNQNVGRQRNRGIELAASRAFPVVGDLSLGYTYLDRDNLSSPTVLPVFTPEQKVRLMSRTGLGSRVALTLTGVAETGRYSQSDGQRKTSGFGTLDAGIEVRITPDVRVAFDGANLTDRLYAYDEGYPEPGRTYAVTLFWEPHSTQKWRAAEAAVQRP